MTSLRIRERIERDKACIFIHTIIGSHDGKVFLAEQQKRSPPRAHCKQRRGIGRITRANR